METLAVERGELAQRVRDHIQQAEVSLLSCACVAHVLCLRHSGLEGLPTNA